MAAAVEAIDLRRTFRSHRGAGPDKVALDDFSLSVDQGETHGLLGPNGAGKTTLVKILATVLLPTAGSARVLGHDVVTQTAAVRQDIGIVFSGERGLYERVSARQNVAFWATLYRLDGRSARMRTQALLERVGMSEHADEPVERLSRGMKQRIHLARGLVHDPPVLFLDEPTTGMDPVASREFRGLVRELQAEGRTVFLATHDMAEAEAICQRVTLIDHGRTVLTDDTAAVGRRLAGSDRIEFACADPLLAAELTALPGVASVTEVGQQDGMADLWRVETLTEDAVGAALRLLVARGVTSVQTRKPSLEEAYLHLLEDRGLTV